MTKRLLTISIIIFAIITLTFPFQTLAATYYYDQTRIGTGICDKGFFSVPVSISWSMPAGGGITRYDNGNLISMNFVSGIGTASANLVNALTVPPFPYTYTVDYIVRDSTNTPVYQTKVVVSCAVGDVISVQIFNNYSVPPPPAPAPTAATPQFEGPVMPDGFVLRTITCDVAVFDMPGGTPLASGEHITAGQTWFVNPKPVAVTNNDLYPSWTEVFTSSYVNGYIPTVCVAN